MKKKITLLSVFLGFSSALFAQNPMWSNQGSLVSIKSAAMLSVHGDALNEGTGHFHNSDTIRFFGNWENNANNEGFLSLGTGVVHFQGDTQYIKGSAITRFYDLRLENRGVKYANIDVYVDGFLRLNDRELNVGTHEVEVFNTALTAVETGINNANFGFVAAIDNGGLIRHTASNLSYAYPLGSSSGTRRFRPIHIRPANSNANAYRARHANIDPSNEGYDRSQRRFTVCEVNPNFYHRIARTGGTAAATVDFFYDINTDGNYDYTGHWDALAWAEETKGTLASASLYGLDRLNGDNPIADFQPFPFALIKVSPPISLAAQQNPICSNDTLVLEANGAYTTFDFFVDSLWMQSSTSVNYQAQLNAGVHPVWVIGNNGICGRMSDTLLVTTLQAPTALASPDTIIVVGTSAQLYASGGDFYDWFPAATLACNTCPNSAANPIETTLYTVLVENIDGCTAMDSVLVTVKAKVEDVLFIPNVITPNGDGKNDTWRIENIQLFPRNRVHIVNRWGDTVYKSEFYNNSWDGSFSGGLLPSGTYYYILDLGDGWGVFKGPLTIIRK